MRRSRAVSRTGKERLVEAKNGACVLETEAESFALLAVDELSRARLDDLLRGTSA